MSEAIDRVDAQWPRRLPHLSKTIPTNFCKNRDKILNQKNLDRQKVGKFLYRNFSRWPLCRGQNSKNVKLEKKLKLFECVDQSWTLVKKNWCWHEAEAFEFNLWKRKRKRRPGWNEPKAFKVVRDDTLLIFICFSSLSLSLSLRLSVSPSLSLSFFLSPSLCLSLFLSFLLHSFLIIQIQFLFDRWEDWLTSVEVNTDDDDDDDYDNDDDDDDDRRPSFQIFCQFINQLDKKIDKSSLILSFIRSSNAEFFKLREILFGLPKSSPKELTRATK